MIRIARAVLPLLVLVPSLVIGAATAARAQVNLPATFSGDLPCADCPGIRYHVNLFPDQTFALRMTYQGRPGTFDSAGRWVRSSDGAVVMLKGAGEPVLLQIRDADTLRPLDRNGNETHSNLNLDLKRAAALAPLDLPPGTVGAERTPPLANAPLAGTNWKLAQVGDQMVPPADPSRQAGLTFDAEGRVSGSDGCNRPTGSYAQKDSGLTFGAIAGTRMACANVGGRDRLFAAALTGTSRWRVTGDRLELLKPDGTRLALLVKTP